MEQLIFKEATHEYFLGDKKLISVTQLMQKHGLAPNYSGVSESVLKAKAERGTLIHKEIEDYINTGELGFTMELVHFIQYVETWGIKILRSETKVYNDLVAGTIDLIFYDNTPTIADIKTTASLHQDAISWQLSIYAYLAKQCGVIETEFHKGQAFHFDKDGELNVVDIPLKPIEEVEKLFECERNGSIYKQELPAVLELEELTALEQTISYYDAAKKQIEAKAQELRATIIQVMEQNGIKSFENDLIKLTYVAPVEKTTLDSARLKKELPDLAEQYSKKSISKASLRITLKKEKNNE